MIVFTRCYQEHITLIVPQAEQIPDAEVLLSPVGKAAIDMSLCMTAWDGVRPVAAAGILDYWRGRGYAWAILSPYASRFMIPISRKIRQVLSDYDARRIEMTVRCDHVEGHRWAKLLGFKVETERMPVYDVNGNDCTMYVRLK